MVERKVYHGEKSMSKMAALVLQSKILDFQPLYLWARQRSPTESAARRRDHVLVVYPTNEAERTSRAVSRLVHGGTIDKEVAAIFLP
jgi:hypothetical protein